MPTPPPAPDLSLGAKKILALHGGGSSAHALRNSAGFRDLQDALGSDFAFVVPDADNGLWIQDSPGGKMYVTTNPNWADDSVALLDKVVEQQGPFHGVLGFSQGAAFVPVYLAKTAATFQAVYLYCGYMPTVHQGLVDVIQQHAPLMQVKIMVWMGAQDFIINNEYTHEFARVLQASRVIVDANAGHALPVKDDATFSSTVQAYSDFSASSATRTGAHHHLVVVAVLLVLTLTALGA